MKTCPQCQIKYPDVLEFCPRDGTPRPVPAGAKEPVVDPILDTTIDGRYAIESRLGEGGMGVVYKARHVLIDKPVAIKILRKEAAQDTAAAPLVLGVRPEHIRFADAAPVRGDVFGAEYLGTTQIVTVDTEHGRVAARLPSAASVRIGERVGLEFNTERLALFDAGTGLAIRTANEGSTTHG